MLAALGLGPATAAAAQDRPRGRHGEHVQDQMPVLNGVPSCDDGDTAIDDSQGSCGAVNTPAIELGDYGRAGDPVALHNGLVSYREQGASHIRIEARVETASGSPLALARRYVRALSLDEPLRLESLAL